MRVVLASNRLPAPAASGRAGGLAVALQATMRGCGGLWLGWNGQLGEDDGSVVESSTLNGIEFASLALPRTLQERSYGGFANGTLWPLFHYFLDGFRFRDEEYSAYRQINRLFAQALAPRLRPGDLIWAHDYHLIPLARELRALGVTAPVGFFLHVPFPQFETLRALPPFAELMDDLCAYDVVGLQTECDRHAFLGAAEAMWGLPRARSDGATIINDRAILIDVFPIGIDVDAIMAAAAEAVASPVVRRMKSGLLDRKLIIGVDRLDYSKGLLERFEAYRRFLDDSPEQAGQVTYLQIAALGRQTVKAYARIRDALEQSAGRINGRFADADWTPIRYLNRNFPHSTLMGLLRASQVCVVTPVRDGMNLVAKEFVAAQDPADPGVLILSDRAGAACELSEALQVNPYDICGIARAIERALEMPLEERQKRHARSLATLRSHDIHRWRERFLSKLASVPG